MEMSKGKIFMSMCKSSIKYVFLFGRFSIENNIFFITTRFKPIMYKVEGIGESL